MSHIPLPQRGQPIDFYYISNIVDQLNTVSSAVSNSVASSTVYSTLSKARQSIPTSKLAFDAGHVDVISSPQEVGTQKSWPGNYVFKTKFKGSPIVTITLVNSATSAVSQDATVTIDSITTTAVNFTVKFPSTSSGKAAIQANIIAIGIANT